MYRLVIVYNWYQRSARVPVLGDSALSKIQDKYRMKTMTSPGPAASMGAKYWVLMGLLDWQSVNDYPR